MSDSTPDFPRCATCRIKKRACIEPGGTGPPFCPTDGLKPTLERALREYDTSGLRAFAHAASVQEAECYANRGSELPVMAIKPRIQETVELAHKMGCRRLGLAFCAGLKREAAIVDDILTAQGFEVVSVICKAGAEPKESIGIAEQDKIRPGGHESMCNPIAQATILNESETEFNIVLGLCVGHDSLFLKTSQALCTVLVVKDRVTGHNPLAAILLHDSYYSRLKDVEF